MRLHAAAAAHQHAYVRDVYQNQKHIKNDDGPSAHQRAINDEYRRADYIDDAHPKDIAQAERRQHEQRRDDTDDFDSVHKGILT